MTFPIVCAAAVWIIVAGLAWSFLTRPWRPTYTADHRLTNRPPAVTVLYRVERRTVQ